LIWPPARPWRSPPRRRSRPSSCVWSTVRSRSSRPKKDEKPHGDKAGAKDAGADKKRGFGRGGKKDGKGGKGGPKRGPEEEKWLPVTKLGRLVNSGAITTVE